VLGQVGSLTCPSSKEIEMNKKEERKKKRRKVILVLSSIIAVLCSCLFLVALLTSSPEEAEPKAPTTEPTSTQAPTATPTTEPTSTHIPTLAPTSTPLPTVLPAALPTAVPQPDTWRCPDSLEGAQYVGSILSGKFHRKGCRHVEQIKPEHRICFANREIAIAAGRTPCGTCNP